MRSLLLSLLLCSLRCAAVEWPVIGAEVETNGFVLRLTISTSPDLGAAAAVTNANFFHGLGTNNSLTATTALTLEITSMGYDDTCTPIRAGRRIVGTKLLRLAYPMQNTNDVIAENGTNIVARVALSSSVFRLDSNITATARSGYLATTNGAGTNAAAFTSITVTNSSLLEWPRVVGNNSWVGFNHETQSVVTVRAEAFHWSAREGRPVRVVKFTATDTAGVSVTNFITRTSIDASARDQTPVPEYIAKMNLAGLTAGAMRFDWAAYPWYGDSSAVLDTSDNVNSAPSPYYSSITNLYDPSFATIMTIAVVDDAAGNDTTGSATNGIAGVIGSVAEGRPFLTLGRALQAITATNNLLYSRNDYSAGWVYMKDGLYSWLGTSATPGNVPLAWITFTRHPSSSRDNVVIQRGATGTATGGTRVRCYDITICATNGAFDVAAGTKGVFYFKDCIINQSNAPSTAAMVQASTGSSPQSHAYVIGGIVSNAPAGLKPFGSQIVGYNLIRGVDFTQYSNQVCAMTILGCYRSGTNRFNNNNAFITTTGGAGDFTKTNWMFCFNRVYGFMTAGAANPIFYSGNQGTEVNRHGAAIVQNIVECWNGTNGNSLFQFAADSATGAAVDNFLVWHNVILGQRANLAYNDTGTVSYDRKNWSIKNNVFDDDNIKTDTFGTPNAARIGNWACVYGVDTTGNMRGELVGTGGTIGASGFITEFNGLNTCWRTLLTNTINRFVAPQSWNMNAGGFGNGTPGDYRIQNSSWLNLPMFDGEWLMGYDIDGKTRGAIDPPGAYSAGNAKKGAMF